jgi:hypothetical protein
VPTKYAKEGIKDDEFLSLLHSPLQLNKFISMGVHSNLVCHAGKLTLVISLHPEGISQSHSQAADFGMPQAGCALSALRTAKVTTLEGMEASYGSSLRNRRTNIPWPPQWARNAEPNPLLSRTGYRLNTERLINNQGPR